MREFEPVLTVFRANSEIVGSVKLTPNTEPLYNSLLALVTSLKEDNIAPSKLFQYMAIIIKSVLTISTIHECIENAQQLIRIPRISPLIGELLKLRLSSDLCCKLLLEIQESFLTSLSMEVDKVLIAINKKALLPQYKAHSADLEVAKENAMQNYKKVEEFRAKYRAAPI